ncbi:hypothetical protein ACFX2J_000696 [Malus domestica]
MAAPKASKPTRQSPYQHTTCSRLSDSPFPDRSTTARTSTGSPVLAYKPIRTHRLSRKSGQQLPFFNLKRPVVAVDQEIRLCLSVLQRHRRLNPERFVES